MNKYKHKIPRDDLKRFAKEIAKKLVASDFKSGRVKNPTKIDEKQQKKVKEYCKQFFDKAAHKHKKHEDERSARKAKKDTVASEDTPAKSPVVKGEYADADEDEDIKMSDHELEDVKLEASATPELATPSETSQGIKRKRESPVMKGDDDGTPQSPLKKVHVDDTAPPPPPPPPPAPDTPMEGTPIHDTGAAEEDEVDMEIDAKDEHEAEEKLHQAHGESNFKTMSVADVRALAQMGDDGDSNGYGDGRRLNGQTEGLDEDEVEW
jgi:[histone H3]-lysine36 N-trimethyltransferase